LTSTFSRLFDTSAAVASSSAPALEIAEKRRPAGQAPDEAEDLLKSKRRKPESGHEAVSSAKPRMTEAEVREREARTLFVGNVPLTWEKKQLLRALKEAAGEKYAGKLGPVWFRAIPLKERFAAGAGHRRKVGAILREYDEKAADAKNAYVVLQSPESVNIMRRVVHGLAADKRHTLRADGVGESSRLQRFDRKRSVFVGGLPSNTGEADLRKVFKAAGDIDAVRVVRDKVTQKCKGIAFVLFVERKSVKAALGLWGAEVLGREIRVTKVEKQDDSGGDSGPQELHPAELRIQAKLRRAGGKPSRPAANLVAGAEARGSGARRRKRGEKQKGRQKSKGTRKGSSPKDRKAKAAKSGRAAKVKLPRKLREARAAKR